MLAFRTNLQNICVTPKLVKKVIINLELSKVPGPDGILAVIMKNCVPELSNILAELFNMCLKETFFSEIVEGFIRDLCIKNIGESFKNYRLLVFFLLLLK